eukprot:CAMPEP_0174818496 /NCGR_PEP_ID=MMETSP1107-20130205/1168_1 /TAXON_ID=36770 /ORGANISM="Paraphysomonas vestita, Strain GFlagA" /LENGTH=265 /DNA_ID=CAMNT_0016030385 /DNA_START=12 /DNA_END=806 /DNA_ORIENTATION=-
MQNQTINPPNEIQTNQTNNPPTEIQILQIINAQLSLQLTSLLKEREDLQKTISDLHSNALNAHLLTEKIKLLDDGNELLKQQNKELQDEIELLKQQNKELQDEIEALKQQNKELRDEIEALNTRVIALENRDVPITVREAMRILEAHICLEAAGSKRKCKDGHYNFEKIRNGETDVQTRLATIISRHGLTNNHINMIGYLKDNGDFSAHQNRPLLTPLELTNVLLEDETNETSSLDEEVVQENDIKKKLLQVLLSYNPCDENETW